jgi:hypothetical protein
LFVHQESGTAVISIKRVKHIFLMMAILPEKIETATQGFFYNNNDNEMARKL